MKKVDIDEYINGASTPQAELSRMASRQAMKNFINSRESLDLEASMEFQSNALNPNFATEKELENGRD